ncbi:hypothetical protein NAPIS_ORF00846 [Vairimorpha apis BRL 01]|uniref:Uncharacterized protein n=1 Tax=Vairimorpha apis BRL 01 TaxID=1037528 RepID=T0LB44_9MICR|nr:hypothetical protein NAPIS_ORF00846 [Vairimorpha apis BRL 01]
MKIYFLIIFSNIIITTYAPLYILNKDVTSVDKQIDQADEKIHGNKKISFYDKELLIVEIEEYDKLANELDIIHGCLTKIIPYVITWDKLGITDLIEAYIQSTTLKKTLESISMEYRRGERIAETEEADH